MSKTNLIFNKKNAVLSISTRNKPQTQLTSTHREQIKEQDGQKLYTFCSSEQKQQLLQPKEENHVSRDRKTSFNNSKSNSFYALSRSKGKNSSQAVIPQSQVRKDNSQLNSSLLSQRRKTEKPTVRQQKKINISININRQHLAELQNKQNQQKGNSFTYEKTQKAIYLDHKKQISAEAKKMIMMSEQQLQYFTRKHANQKLKLEQTVQKLQRQLKQTEQKQKQWKLFKKDSEEYIRYLQKEKQDLYVSNQSLKQQIIQFSSDRQYYQIAKQEHKRTISEQQEEIHALHQQLLQHRQQIQNLKGLVESSRKKSRVNNNQQVYPLQILSIENEHLKKELDLSQKQSSRNLLLLTEIEQLRRGNIDLSSANTLLTNQIKDVYSFKIKQSIYQQTINELTANVSQLSQENRSLKHRLALSKRSDQQPRSQFEFRLDTSPQSPSQVEVIWKRSQQWSSGGSKKVPDYFDHDFFSGNRPQRP